MRSLPWPMNGPPRCGGAQDTRLKTCAGIWPWGATFRVWSHPDALH